MKMNPFGRFMDPEAGRKKEMKKQFMQKAKQTFSELVPESVVPMLEDVTVSEMLCGDPECAPVDTIFRLIYKDAPIRMFGIPKEVEEVTDEDIKEFMPTADVLEGWGRGENREWPPLPDAGEPPEVDLRFDVGARVECRVGATTWAPGIVIKLWYREPGWPTGHFAPYQIALDNGKRIFAPKDEEMVIRAEAAEGAAEDGMAQGHEPEHVPMEPENAPMELA